MKHHLVYIDSENEPQDFTIESSLPEMKAEKFGYVYRDWELEDYLFDNSSTNQIYNTFTDISKGTYVNIVVQSLDKSNIDGNDIIFCLSSTPRFYGIETIVTSPTTPIINDHGVVILNYGSVADNYLVDNPYTIDNNTTHITFKDTNIREFKDFNIVVASRTTPLNIYFENFRYKAQSGKDDESGTIGLNIQNSATTTIVYKGSNSITGGDGGKQTIIGQIGANGTNGTKGIKGNDGLKNQTRPTDKRNGETGKVGGTGNNAEDNSIKGKGYTGTSGGDAVFTKGEIAFENYQNDDINFLTLQGGKGGKGGLGGKGGTGGKGGQGGDGGDAGYSRHPKTSLLSVGNPGIGGKGGNGGNGGKGGQGGTGGDGGYAVRSESGSLNIEEINGLKFNASEGGAGGQGGAGGDKGSGGDAGLGGKIAKKVNNNPVYDGSRETKNEGAGSLGTKNGDKGEEGGTGQWRKI